MTTLPPPPPPSALTKISIFFSFLCLLQSLSIQLRTTHQEKADTADSLTLEKNQLMESLARTAERQGILESELSSLQTELSTALSQAEANKKATDSVCT